MKLVSRSLLRFVAMLTREPDNLAALQELESKRTRIELFDIVWWILFRRLETASGSSVMSPS